MKSVEAITSAPRAAAILRHPLRPHILAHAREPISASELARRLGQPRQRVNHHVRQLAREGLLRPTAQQQRRNMVEQQYVASARAYVISPEVLGAAAPGAEPDAASAEQLVRACARAQSEVADVIATADAAGLRLRTLTLDTAIRFESAAQRTSFANELTEAIEELIARHTSSSGQAGRSFRLLVGCYPLRPEGT